MQFAIVANEEGRAQRGEMFCLKSPRISRLDPSLPTLAVPSPYSRPESLRNTFRVLYKQIDNLAGFLSR